MSICRGCGREIDWIRTVAGKNMPVDPAPVFVIEGGGNDRFVTDEGEVITGRVVYEFIAAAGVELDGDMKKIVDGAIEAAVFALPKTHTEQRT